ncbi:expressed unknown protein [Seminavis robusta]|uniref:VWFD domain-containing protein n=1 Tax=Seminavis robusta TaxID=568900 RepID=A0A9N8H7D5_9STRA|nr:expressed unknown protein [Seminavis robusta]|eukprot:Sro200_g084830.1 n/a (398) ;mRNA; f:65763-67206
MKISVFSIIIAGLLALPEGKAQDSGFGACFSTSNCGGVYPDQAIFDTTLEDCVLTEGASFGILQDGEPHCVQFTYHVVVDGERRALGAAKGPDQTQALSALQKSRILEGEDEDEDEDKDRGWWDSIVEVVKEIGKTIREVVKEIGKTIREVVKDAKEVIYKICENDDILITENKETKTSILRIKTPQAGNSDNNDRRLRSFHDIQPGCAYFCSCGGIIGEPHIKQLLGGWFDYHGECDMVFSHAPNFGNGIGLDIHARTKIRYAYSYILSASIRIGNEILEIAGWGDYILNGVGAADLTEATLEGYPIASIQLNKKQHSFLIDLGGNVTLSINTNKDIVSIKLNPGEGYRSPEMHEWFGNSSGLMGSISSGKKLARDGVTVIEDPNEFGQEWQVNDG